MGNSSPDGAKQGFLAEWFPEKATRAGPDRIHVILRISRSSHEDYWNLFVLTDETALQFEAAHFRHAYVEDEAGSFVEVRRLQESLRGKKAFNPEPICR